MSLVRFPIRCVLLFALSSSCLRGHVRKTHLHPFYDVMGLLNGKQLTFLQRLHYMTNCMLLYIMKKRPEEMCYSEFMIVQGPDILTSGENI